ncbi:hypothetical protein SNEBB_009670 [Seison nebaliae]|nr:hypothetical protein SNEBB_009670 [Seison nebaliae]
MFKKFLKTNPKKFSVDDNSLTKKKRSLSKGLINCGTLQEKEINYDFTPYQMREDKRTLRKHSNINQRIQSSIKQSLNNLRLTKSNSECSNDYSEEKEANKTINKSIHEYEEIEGKDDCPPPLPPRIPLTHNFSTSTQDEYCTQCHCRFQDFTDNDSCLYSDESSENHRYYYDDTFVSCQYSTSADEDLEMFSDTCTYPLNSTELETTMYASSFATDTNCNETYIVKSNII